MIFMEELKKSLRFRKSGKGKQTDWRVSSKTKDKKDQKRFLVIQVILT